MRIINAPMGQELIAELNSFEVDFTSTGNMRVDVRSNGNHGDLVIATALAPRLAAIKNQNRKTPNCASHLQLTPITAT